MSNESPETVKNRTTSFQVGPDAERDIVCVEDLLMKLALAELVIRDMERYIDAAEKNDGLGPDGTEAPGTWALAGLHQNLMEVSRALKCGCWGYEKAYMR